MSGTPKSVERSKQYKNVNRVEDARRRRVDASLELRKQKRDELVMKRRNINTEELSDDEESQSTKSTELEQSKITGSKTEVSVIKKLTLNEIIHIKENVPNPTEAQLIELITSLRKILSGSKNPPLDEVMKGGLAMVIVHLLNVPNETIVFEALWALTNILSGDSRYVRAMIALGCLPWIQKHMLSSSMRVAEQATWAIANVFGDSPDLRDECVEAGFLDTIGSLMLRFSELTPEFQRTLCWVLSNIVRHHSPNHCSLDVAKTVVQFMSVAFHTRDMLAMRDCFWGISYLSDTTSELVDVIVACGLVPFLIDSLGYKIPELVPPALRALGNIVAGEDRHTQTVIDSGLLESSALKDLFDNEPTTNVRKEILWMISNVSAGTVAQVEHLLATDWLPRVVSALANADAKSQTEASYVAANLSHPKREENCRALINAGFIPVAARVVDHGDYRVSVNMLESLQSIFDTIESDSDLYEKLLTEFEAADGVDKLESLQEHENNDVYTKALQLIQSHFNDDNEDQSENLSSKTSSIGQEHQSRGQPLKPNFNF